MIKTFILAVQTAPTNNAGMNLWDMVVMGGWLMIPIFILSVIIIYIACERFWLIRKTGLTDVPFMEKIQEILKTGNTRVALEECEKEGSPLAHTIAKGIKISNEDPQEIRQAMEDTANYEVANLERGLPTLCRNRSHDRILGNRGRDGTIFLRYVHGRKQHRRRSPLPGYLHRHDHHRGRVNRRNHRTVSLQLLGCPC